MKARNVSIAGLCFVVLQCVATASAASEFYSGTTTIAWTAPVLSGVILDAATGLGAPADFSASAACNIAGCPTQLSGYSSSTLAFGDYVYLPTVNPTSTVTFTPSTFSNVVSNQIFKLGTLSYLNGTSTNTIFGATLTIGISLANNPTIVDPLVVALGIVTTTNDGSDAQNADFLDFRQAFGTIQPVTFNVYENATATADLYGSIVGDPYLTAAGLIVEPGSAGDGFIGSGLPIPEPSSWALMAIGLAALGARTRRAGLEAPT